MDVYYSWKKSEFREITSDPSKLELFSKILSSCPAHQFDHYYLQVVRVCDMKDTFGTLNGKNKSFVEARYEELVCLVEFLPSEQVCQKTALLRDLLHHIKTNAFTHLDVQEGTQDATMIKRIVDLASVKYHSSYLHHINLGLIDYESDENSSAIGYWMSDNFSVPNKPSCGNSPEAPCLACTTLRRRRFTFPQKFKVSIIKGTIPTSCYFEHVDIDDLFGSEHICH